MNNDDSAGQRTAILLAVPGIGILALTLIEVIREAALPPVGMLVTLLILSVIPVVLLCTTASRRALWGVFAVAALMSLFHGMHALEHVFIPDWELTALVLATMFAPSILGARQVWMSLRAGLRRPTEAQIESRRRRWQIAGRVLVATFLGYLLANSLGLFLVFALPMDRLTGVAFGTILSFLVWGGVVMWVFAAKRLRSVTLSLAAAISLTGAAAWGLYVLEQSS